MKEPLLERFKQLFNEYKNSEQYEFRKKQFSFISLAKEIISETLKQTALQNEHLTGLIQMLKWECTESTFNKYLEVNILNPEKREEFKIRFKEIGNIGYTGTGLNSISGLSDQQLLQVKEFIQEAFDVTTVVEANQLCAEFEKLNIPQVKSGIYSPWLYYINPKLFPISNTTHEMFKKWLDLPIDYPNYINEFNQLSHLVGEDELGPLDDFAHRFTTDEFYWDVEAFIKKLHSRFKNIWRCATSSQWEHFKSRSVLSINWLDNSIDYTKLKNIGEGKMPVTRWVKNLKQGDLIFILDKYNYYGIAVAKSIYKYKENDIEFAGKSWPCIEIEFIHYLDKPVNHLLTISHTNPATFFELNGLSFDEKSTLLFLRKSFPDAIEKLKNYLNPSKEMKDTVMVKNQNCNFPKNIILYGPPGTGKTYNTINKSLEILSENISGLKRKEIKEKFSEFEKNRKVFFTTFHQNLSYEDFIEGIKPKMNDEDDEILKYEIQDGLFMIACVEATYNYIQENFKQQKTIKTINDFNSCFDALFDEVLSKGVKPLKSKNQQEINVEITNQGNFSARHGDKEKPYTVSRERLARLYNKFPDPDKIQNINNEIRNTIGGCNSTAYWAVLKEIATIRDKNKSSDIIVTSQISDASYEDKRIIVRQFWDAKEFKIVDEDNSTPYVIIIDEINRGNVAQIFGELITLIEDDKRLGKIETIYADLPYSKHAFAVPPNLYIIGTMNTADRSVEALDTALRRRFSFVHMKHEVDKLSLDCDGINLRKLLETLNRRLGILKDDDHTIGHAWLMGVKNLEEIKAVFANKILPLLQEYFYNDYEKLGLVLGDAFFVTPHERVGSNEFAKFTGSNGLAGQYNNMNIYKLKNPTELTGADFLTLTTAVTDNEI